MDGGEYDDVNVRQTLCKVIDEYHKVLIHTDVMRRTMKEK